MRETRCISLILLACALMAGDADAAPTTIWGQPWQSSASCPGGGSLPNVRGSAGYVVDPATGTPQTGDVGEVVGFAANIGCVSDGASMKFFLPLGARLDGTVICTVSDGTTIWPLDPALCAQTPAPDSNGGLLIASSSLPRGWWMQVRVPVRYERELSAVAGDGLKVEMVTAWGTLQPVVAMNVAYRAQLLNPTASVAATSATIGYSLFTYLRGGQLTFDWGTSAALGNPPLTGTVPAGYVSFTPNAMLSSLLPSTQYYWRARFVADNGFTVTSPIHNFVTAAGAPVPLSVIMDGIGRGRVTSTPVGIDCITGSSASCSMNVPQGTLVRLTATPASAQFVFVGWSGGGCSGTGVCNVTVANATSVTASFHYVVGTPLPDLPLPPPRR